VSTITLKRWDAANDLRDEDDIVAYLAAIGEENDPALMLAALNDVARARNMSKLAEAAGLTRQGLYKALADGGNPSFATVAKVAAALGFRLALVPGRSG